MREVWDSSAVVSEHARALGLGVISEGQVELSPSLPLPYTPLYAASKLNTSLSPCFSRIGLISGTNIPFGVSIPTVKDHHLAILGMSGMGKSTIARRLVHLLSETSMVIAMDGTGEYRSRFGLNSWTSSVGLSNTGCWVYEPSGVQAKAATDFIKENMSQSHQEFQSGNPRSRTLLLEEAHTFLPEWNSVAERNEQNFVAESCRYILQSRKFRLNFIFVSQRTAVISKSALSQCESYIFFRTLDETSLQYIDSVLGHELRDTVTGLKRYQAICFGPAFSASTPMIVNLDQFVDE